MINYVSLIANIVGGIKGFIFAFSKLGKFLKYLGNLELIANGLSAFLNAFHKLFEICVNIKNSKAGKWLLLVAGLILSALGVYVWLI